MMVENSARVGAYILLTSTPPSGLVAKKHTCLEGRSSAFVNLLTYCINGHRRSVVAGINTFVHQKGLTIPFLSGNLA